MENFIQVCNYQGDPILVGLTSGNGFWALPPGTAFTNLILVARTEESGTVCYEDPILRTTTSSFPRRTSPAARKLIARLETMTRAESEELFGRYSEEVSATHMEMLEKYRSECEQSRPVAEVVPSAPPPAALAPPPPMEIFERNADGRHQLALLRCGNLNKLATVSNRNWKRRFFRLTAVSLAYFESANVSSGTVPKGEVQIAGDGRVEIVPKVDGFGFRYTAPSVSSKVVLSANSEIEREAWMDSLSTASALMGKCLREPIVLRSLQSFPKDDPTAFLAALAAQTSRKAVALLSKDGISIHDPRSISKVQAVFGINSSTTVHFIAERSVALLNAPGIWYSKGNELQGIAIDFTNMFDRWKLRILGATASATAQRGFDGVRDRAQSMGSVEASPGRKGNALEMAALRRLQKKQSPAVSRDVAPTSEVCSQYASQIKRLGDELEEMEDTASTVEITKNAIASVNEINFIPNTADSVSRRSSDTDGDQKRDAKASQERKASKLALYRKEQRRSYVAANSTASHAPNGIDTSATLECVGVSLDALFVQRRPSATSAVDTANDQLVETPCMDSPTNYPEDSIRAISMPPSALNALQVAALRKQRRQSTVVSAPVVVMSTNAASTPALDEELAAVEVCSWEKKPLSFEVKEHVTTTETDNAHSSNALKTVPLVDNATLSAVSVTVSARPSNALKMAALRRQMRKQPSTTMNSSDVRQSTIDHVETAVVAENEDVEVAAVSPTPVPPNRAAPVPMDSFPAFVSSGRDEDSSVTSDLPRLSDIVMRFATPLNQIVVEDSVITGNGALQQHQPLQKDRDIARSESSMTIDSEEPRRGQQSSSSQDGSLTLLDMFDRAQHKPLVRLIFEHFSHPNSYLRTTRSRNVADNVLDVSALQTLSYELGCYCSLEDAQLAIQLYSSKSKNKKKRTFLGYEDFLVYWRSHAVFSTLRSFDPLAKRRVCIAAQFRAYDVLAQGHVKLSSFRLVFEQLLASNYLRPMKQYVGPPSSQRLYADILAAVDKYSSGRVSLNLFVAYMDMNVPIYTSKPSKLGRLWAKLLPVTATKQLSGRPAQQLQPASNNSNSGMRDLRVEHFRRSVTADDLVALMSDEEESEEAVEEAANEVDTHLMVKEEVVEEEQGRGERTEVGGDVQEAIALRCDSPLALPTARAPSPTPSVSSSSSAKRRRLLAMQGLRGKAPAAVAPPVATPEEVYLVVTTPHEVRPALPPISASALPPHPPPAPPATSTFTSTSATEVMSNPLQRMARPLRPVPASLPAPPPPPSTSPAPLKHPSVPLTPPAPPLKCASPPPPPPPSTPVTPQRQRRMSQPSAPTPRTPDCIPSGVCEVSSDFRPLRSTSSEAQPSLSHCPSSGLISYEDVLVERHALHQLEEDLKELTSLTERRMQAREQKALSRLHLVAAAHRDQAESQRTHLAILNDAFAMQRMEDVALLRECANRVLVEEVRQQALEQRQLAALRHLADGVGAMHGDVCRRRSELARSLVTSHSNMVEAAELVSGRDYFNSLQYLAARRQVAETLKIMDADLSKSASTFADGYRGEDEHKGVDMAVAVDLSSGEAGDWDYTGYADEDC